VVALVVLHHHTATDPDTSISSGTVLVKDHLAADHHWGDRQFCPADAVAAQWGCYSGRADHYTPECWLLGLVDGRQSGSVCVSRDVWDRTPIGAKYDG
jgi:hypothetical protein